MVSAKSGKVLDVVAQSIGNGVKVSLWQDKPAPSASQQFYFAARPDESGYAILNALSQQVLTFRNGADGLTFRGDSAEANQTWVLEPFPGPAG